MKRAARYHRVSTQEQARSGLSLEHQRIATQELIERRGWMDAGIFEDPGVSSAAKKRPGFSAALRQIKDGKADVLVVTRLDRAWRSVRDMIATLDNLHAWGGDLVMRDLDIDTTTPHGRLMLNMIAGLAQWEREMISLRIKEGLSAKRARGERLGRETTPRMALIKPAVRELRALGYSLWEISRQLRERGIRNNLGNNIGENHVAAMIDLPYPRRMREPEERPARFRSLLAPKRKMSDIELEAQEILEELEMRLESAATG